ncbi:MAG: ribose-5-phosphate isomerase RpiA [Myxococcaceae bacterium]|nr:ribose-5-phosphate isomerase RpiA [Myxococcaceae bacterium]
MSEALKKAVGEAAVNAYVKSGMKLGLGTGSTVTFSIDLIGAKLKRGELRDIVGVSTSERTTKQATSLGIPLSDLQQTPQLDVAVDGADEVVKAGESFFLIKGLGGALLREKEVAKRSKQLIIVADDSKVVKKLGTKSPLPVEVEKSAWQAVAKALEGLGGTAKLRESSGQPYVTDNGNHIVDVKWAEGIDDPRGLGRTLDGLAGVKAHGLFLDLTHAVLIASPKGVVTVGRADPLP